MNDPALKRLIEAPRKALVVAHPASGTQFLCERLRDAGLEVVHERVEDGVLLPDVTVSWRYWPWSGPVPWSAWGSTWALLRDPLRMVFSAGALFQKRPDVLHQVWAEFKGGNDCPPDEYVAACWTVDSWFRRIHGKTIGCQLLRVEDLVVPEGASLNRHARLVASWENLHGRCRDFSEHAIVDELEGLQKLHYGGPAA